MPLLKRKPVLYHPLPSLATVVQPIVHGSRDTETTPPPTAPAPPPAKSKKSAAAAQPEQPEASSSTAWVPPDADSDEGQLKVLSRVFDDALSAGRSKKAGTWILSGPLDGVKSDGEGQKQNGESSHAHAHTNGNGQVHGEMPPPPLPSTESWKVTDREVFYIPETGEIFTDYDSYLARMSFFQQPLFQCEVSGKSALSYFAALANERKEIRQLHTRFPKPLKKAVLTAVQFQVEGKLETLADRVFDRFVNRFFENEKVFVDVQGDKYLARIVKTFPPKTLASASASSSPVRVKSEDAHASTTVQPLQYHTLGANLSLDPEEVLEQDDPMKYFYSVRLIVEGAETAHAAAAAGSGEEFEGSVMEVQADKISRDRINFSRVMLKRFMRDCVTRDAAVYSPWTVKPAVAARYGIPTEMSEETKEEIATFRERQMDRRKREREERLGITHDPDAAAEEEGGGKGPSRKKSKKSQGDKDKDKLEKEEAAKKAREEEEKRKKPLKYPAEDFLVEYAEKDEKEGRPLVRPAPSKSLPFGQQFEKLLLSWSFLNVMGKPLGLSSFTLDDFEQSLYHKDWTTPAPLMAELHACLLNALIRDLRNGAEPVKSLATSGTASVDPGAAPTAGEAGEEGGDDAADYWEGNKGATTETLRPIASQLATTWAARLYPAKEARKGWESALVGVLWERARLSTLPSYLDNILHLIYEDKPAPTRPTWSTAPSTQTSINGLIPSKPEKRYPTIHHSHKLDIIAWLIELVAQTAVIRDFMEESTAALTEVRKEQIDVKREWRKVQADIQGLEPKKEAEANGEPETNGNGNGHAEQADGDVSMSISAAPTRSASPNQTEQDELEDSDGGEDDDAGSSTGADPHDRHVIVTASRRQAMAVKAAERAEEEAMRVQKANALKLKSLENKALSAEKRRLLEEDDRLTLRLRELDHEFRSHLFTLRARPLGVDRFGNRVWWMDGLGSSAPLLSDGKYNYGTGRLYLQGVETEDLEYMIMVASAEHDEVTPDAVRQRREKEEGPEQGDGGMLQPGEWAVYDHPDQLHGFINWLNPRGTRDVQLLRLLKQWLPELEGGMRRRRTVIGLEEEEGVRRSRPVRRVAGGEEEGYMGWRNKRAT